MSVPWTWVPTTINNDSYVLCITGDSTGQYILAGGYDHTSGSGGVFYSTDYGLTWSRAINFGESSDLGNVVGVACSANGSRMYAVTNDSSGGLYYSTNYGGSWTHIDTSSTGDNNFSGVCCNALGKNVVVITNAANGGAGKSWYSMDPISSPSWSDGDITGQNWTSVAVNSNGSQFFALASDNGGVDPGLPGLYRSTNGLSWTKVNYLYGITGDQTWTSVAFSRDDSTAIICSRGYGGNSSGIVYINTTPSVDSGWTEVVADSIPFINVALSTDGSKVYACDTANGLSYGTAASITLDATSTSLGTASCVYIKPASLSSNSGNPVALGQSAGNDWCLYTVQTYYSAFTITNVTTSSLTITNFQNLNGGSYAPSAGDVLGILEADNTGKFDVVCVFEFIGAAVTVEGTYAFGSFTPSSFVPILNKTYSLVIGPLNTPGYSETYENFMLVGPPPICFKEGSQILCLIDGVEQYIPVETMTPGTLVKTALNGYKKVEQIGFSKLYNPGNGTKSIHHLVKCTPAKYPELTEDLVLTGSHSILVNDITDKQRADLTELAGRVFITDDKYRLMACLDDRSEPYEAEGLFTIWHFALEHEQYTWNYGVYANGLLVESTSLRMMKEFSGMTLLN